MFHKRSDNDEPRVESATVPPIDPAPARAEVREAATIGPTIRVRGDLAGEEDLVVQGRVEGTIDLPKNLVTVGKDGKVNATVNARVIQVEGQVEGDLNGQEQVVLKRSGHVRGNITAPRVTLEDGCRFKGSIDMDVAQPGAKVADLKPAASGADDGAKGARGSG